MALHLSEPLVGPSLSGTQGTESSNDALLVFLSREPRAQRAPIMPCWSVSLRNSGHRELQSRLVGLSHSGTQGTESSNDALLVSLSKEPRARSSSMMPCNHYISEFPSHTFTITLNESNAKMFLLAHFTSIEKIQLSLFQSPGAQCKFLLFKVTNL